MNASSGAIGVDQRDILDLCVRIVDGFHAGSRRERWPVPAESELVWVRYEPAAGPDHRGRYL